MTPHPETAPVPLTEEELANLRNGKPRNLLVIQLLATIEDQARTIEKLRECANLNITDAAKAKLQATTSEAALEETRKALRPFQIFSAVRLGCLPGNWMDDDSRIVIGIPEQGGEILGPVTVGDLKKLVALRISGGEAG